MKKLALITGATSGIGEAISRTLSVDYNLILCGRNEGKLSDLAEELGLKTEVKTLAFDVRYKEEVVSVITSLPCDWQNIDVLINNAGNAHGRSLFHEGDTEDWDAMVDSNLKGVLYVSRQVIPQMVARKTGDVINIGSIAGKEAYEQGNVYCATKYGIDGLTKSMRHELITHGIRVMCINPGLVNTGFSLVRFKGDQEKADDVYKGVTPLTAQDVADVVKFSIDRPRHVNMADVTVLASSQANATTVHREDIL